MNSPSLAITSAVVRRALHDAELLIANSDATSAVDRVHTAMHGYLREVCRGAGILFSADATIGNLLGAVRDKHPAFAAATHRADDVRKVLRAMGAVADALNPIRNQASVAHPNAHLLDAPEAMLIVNVVRTLLQYLDSSIARPTAGP